MRTLQKLRFSIFALMLLFCFSSCQDGNTSGKLGLVNVKFKAKYGGDALVMNTPYDMNGIDVSFSRLHFFGADLNLVQESREVELDDISLIDFTSTHTSATAANSGYALPTVQIAVGSYDGIKLGIGVPSDLNDDTPADYASTHPLGKDLDYWSAWGSYIFAKVEGRYDADDDGDYEGTFIFHIGADSFYRTKDFSNLDFSIVENGNLNVQFNVDFEQIFRDGQGSWLDLEAVNFTHSSPDNPEEVQLSTLVVNNLTNAITLE